MVSWLLRCMEEFFKQGDKEQEQGLDFSPLCDRQTTMVPQSQIGANHSSSKYVKFFLTSVAKVKGVANVFLSCCTFHEKGWRLKMCWWAKMTNGLVG